jgi:hypothetical protein
MKDKAASLQNNSPKEFKESKVPPLKLRKKQILVSSEDEGAFDI